jgi:predicted NAD/FAD-dependent oxidoreductase
VESAERTTSTPPTVTVVGAGTGGLTLARILHAHGVRVTVLDGDASAPARTRGGMLDVHHDSGQEALRAAGLHEQFTALVHAGGGAVRLLDRYGVVRMEQEDDGAGGRPEVARPRFRRLLLDGLPPHTVRWAAEVTRVRALENGRHEVAPADGMSFALGAGRGVLAHRRPDSTLHVHAMLTVPEEWAAGVNPARPEAARTDAPQGLLDRFAAYQEPTAGAP